MGKAMWCGGSCQVAATRRRGGGRATDSWTNSGPGCRIGGCVPWPLEWSIGVVAVTVPSSSSGAGGVPCAVGRRLSIAWRRHGGREECRVRVLHGLWSASSGPGIWAEDSERAVRSPSQALRSARPHPFAAPAGAVAGIHPGKAARTVLLLPSVRSAPLDSPELLRVTPRPAPRTGVALLPTQSRWCGWMPRPRWQSSTSR